MIPRRRYDDDLFQSFGEGRELNESRYQTAPAPTQFVDASCELIRSYGVKVVRGTARKHVIEEGWKGDANLFKHNISP